ncbi:hypothetical protein ONS95_002253 [Cadophora gregata]|uniref:uncharacterized protein n=1 Tax=Cadophora gregata TaxID=51156 RepID=UPI0026DB5A39|nr:uncharacterized protein ONS95_002253 [Cadophora gregata]KAK0109567.1 hypothetical protein ONS95_002253 [Cadophora gregata]KAK0110804.1 hypothetical protein ONS96_002397 [Cadophora gregata f. sp. sojae]
MTQERKRTSARATEGHSPPFIDSSKDEDRSFSDIEEGDISSQSDVTVTPYNVSRVRAIDTVNDSGVGSEVSTPILERLTAGLGCGSYLDCDSQPPDLEIVEPLPGHRRVLTVVLLHANDSSGAKLKHQLLDATKCSSGKTLQQELPGVRWIFPTAPFICHVKADKSIEKRRMWVDFGIYDEEGESSVKMYESLRYTMDAVRKIIESEGRALGFEKQLKNRVSWEHAEIVFGGHWDSAASALATWMCSGTNFAGFMGLRGVLPDQEAITQKYKEDVASGRPPGRGSDFGQNTNDFIASWTSTLTRQNNLFVQKMASTPVLLTLHESDTHWLFGSEKLARAIYQTLIGPAKNLFIKCFGSPVTLQSRTQGVLVEELDAIQTYLRCLAFYRKDGSGVTFQEWIKGQAKLFQ